MDNPCDIPNQFFNSSTMGESSTDEFSKLRACWREVYQQNQPIMHSFSSSSSNDSKQSRKRTISEEQRIKNNLRRRTSEISEEARTRRNARRRVGVISEEMRLKQNERRKVGVISEEKRIRQNARRRVGTISEEQRLKQNLRRRVGVISEEQRMKQNLRRRVGAISEEQRLRQNMKRRKSLKSSDQKDNITLSNNEESTRVKNMCSFVPHHFLLDDQFKKKTYLREYYRNRALSEEYRLLKNLKSKKGQSKTVNSFNNIHVEEECPKLHSGTTHLPNTDINHISSRVSGFQCSNLETASYLTLPTNSSVKEYHFSDNQAKFPPNDNSKQLAEKCNYNFFLKCMSNESRVRNTSQEKCPNNIVIKTEDFENYEKFIHWMEN